VVYEAEDQLLHIPYVLFCHRFVSSISAFSSNAVQATVI